MNKKKDHLFHLIKSLSKSEKRYFTLDAQKSGRKESRYLELFRAINQQEEYDEKALKKAYGKKLGDDKSRLYEAILRSMRDYQSHKSYKARIKELLTDAKLLFERKLYEQAENRLSEAKELALELQDHLSVLEINLEQRQLTREIERKHYGEKARSLIQEKDHQMEYLRQQFLMQDIFDRLTEDMLKNPQLLNKKDIPAFKEKYQAIFDIEPEKLSFFARRKYHQCRALYFRLVGTVQDVFEESTKTRLLWKKAPKKKQEYYSLYLFDAVNLLSISMRDKSTIKSFPILIEEIKNEKAPSPQAAKTLFERTANLSLFYLINNKEQKFDQTVNDIKKDLEQYNITISTRLSIYINLVVVFFLNDRFKDSLIWSEKINELTQKSKSIRIDIQQTNRIIQLFAIYKLNDYDKIENALRRTNRFFTKQNNSDTKAIAEYVIQAIKHLQAAISSKEEHLVLVNLKENIKTVGPKQVGGLDELSLLWINSLLDKKTIAELK